MIIFLLIFTKIFNFFKVKKIAENSYEMSGNVSFNSLQESEQKFQSFITTSQFTLKSNEYMYSAFPRSTDLITLNQISSTCQIPLFLLGNTNNQPIIHSEGSKITVTNIVHFSYSPLNEILIGDELEINSIEKNQQFQVAKNNDNMAIMICLSLQEITFDLKFESLDYNEIESHKGFLQRTQNIEENCVQKTRNIYSFDLLKPFNFDLVDKNGKLKILIEHQNNEMLAYYDLNVNTAYIERGQTIKITCTNQNIENQNFIVKAFPEKSDAGNTILIVVIVISVIVGIGVIVTIIILVLIYYKKKNIKENLNESQIKLQNIFGGLQGNTSSDEERGPRDDDGKKSLTSLEQSKGIFQQENYLDSQAKTEQYQYGSNLDFDTDKLKKASFDLDFQEYPNKEIEVSQDFLAYENQKTKKNIQIANQKQNSNLQQIQSSQESQQDYDFENQVSEKSLTNSQKNENENKQENQKLEENDILSYNQSNDQQQNQSQQQNLQNQQNENFSDKEKDTLLNQFKIIKQIITENFK